MTKQMANPEFANVQGDFFFSTEGKGEFYTSGMRNPSVNCRFGGEFNGLQDLLDLRHSFALFVL